MKFQEMTPDVTLDQQLTGVATPVVLLNRFDVAPEDVEDFLNEFSKDAAFFKQQSGFVSAQMLREIGGNVFMNYVVWKTVADFGRFFANPEFKARLEAYPSNAIASPHLFELVSIPGFH